MAISSSVKTPDIACKWMVSSTIRIAPASRRRSHTISSYSTEQRFGSFRAIVPRTPTSEREAALLAVRVSVMQLAGESGGDATFSALPSRVAIASVCSTSACDGVAASGEKAHQLGVDSIGVRPQHAVRTARQLDELDVLDHLRLPSRGGVRRQDAVGIAVQDERRHRVLGDVLAEVLDPASTQASVSDGGGAGSRRSSCLRARVR